MSNMKRMVIVAVVGGIGFCVFLLVAIALPSPLRENIAVLAAVLLLGGALLLPLITRTIKIEAYAGALIKRPVDEVFAYLSNPANSPKWISRLRRTEIPAAGVLVARLKSFST